MIGYIYIMSNSIYKDNRIKIGMSNRHPKIRLSELNTTGVPEPFKLEYMVKVENYVDVEKKVHRELKEKRPRNNKEFFICSIPDAIIAIRENSTIVNGEENIFYKSPQDILKEEIRRNEERKRQKEKKEKELDEKRRQEQRQLEIRRLKEKEDEIKLWCNTLYETLYFNVFQTEFKKIYPSVNIKSNNAYSRADPDLLKLVILYFVIGTLVVSFIFLPLVLVVTILGIIHIIYSNKKMKELDIKLEPIEEKARLEIRKFCDTAYEKLMVSDNLEQVKNQLISNGKNFTTEMSRNILKY